VAGLLVAVHGDSAVAIDVMRGRADCRDPALAGHAAHCPP
jgi:hypothetical protein